MSVVRLLLLLLLLPAAMFLVACDEEIVVRQQTVVYPDGSVYRRVDIHGRKPDGETPVEPGWLRREVGLSLAEPDAWRLLEERPDALAVEAVFDTAEQVPVALAHDTDQGTVADRADVRLEVQDLVVLTRRVYEETVADPFGDSSLEAALDALTEVAAATLAEQLRLELGSLVDVAPATTFVRTEGRAVAAELLGILKEQPGPHATADRSRRLAHALALHAIPEPEDLAQAREWGDALGLLLDPVLLWSRDRVAGLLSAGEDRIAGEDLSFWPTGDELGETVGTITDAPEDPRVTEFKGAADALLRSMEGYYADPSSAGFRFESRVDLPGRLLRTNGTPVDDGVLWVADNEELSGGVTMRVESVELDTEALVRLGARRDLNAAELLLLCELLTDRERGERLRDALALAVEEGGFHPLADERLVEEAGADARALLELLDPALTRWP